MQPLYKKTEGLKIMFFDIVGCIFKQRSIIRLHFRELNSDPLFSGTVLSLYNPVITIENNGINRPLSLEEVKLAI